MYITTKFEKYHSNISGSTIVSSHPDTIILPGGETVICTQDIRDNAISSTTNSRKMIALHPQVKFSIISEYDNDCNRSGSTIRWSVPKGSQLIWHKIDEDGFTEIVAKNIVV